MIIQCCVCKNILGTKEPYGEHSRDFAHSYCQECYAIEKAEIQMAQAETNRANSYFENERFEGGT